ncbi:MAG: hypothetical protein AAF514_01715, partial [Verrucomicrobiota bacterium]
MKDFPFSVAGVRTLVPLLVGLAVATVLPVVQSEIVIDGDFADWETLGQSVPVVEVEDGQDLPDSSGDLRKISAMVEGEELVLSMTVDGVFGPSPEETPEGKTNRYYYHWILDTDNNPATGVSNSTYENNPTGVEKAIGTDVVIQLGWRDGETNGVYAYNPLDPDEGALIEDYDWTKEGDTVTAWLPLETFGLQVGQTIRFSAFQEGASDGWLVDWMESGELKIAESELGGNAPVEALDGKDLPDSSGDLRGLTAMVEGEMLRLTLSVDGVFGPSPEETPEGKTNRYYYHWLLDTDNNPATGVSNSTYENQPTGADPSIGTEVVIQLGWRDGETNGVYAYNPLDPDEGALIENYEWTKESDTVTAWLPLETFGLQPGQTIRVSAFQEGASDGWLTDWMTSVELKIPDGGPTIPVVEVEDAKDLPDSSGDLRKISATVEGSELVLSLFVDGVFGPSPEETPDGKTNRYYYHWILDTDNNPATGVSNSTYENNPTGVENPIGTDVVVQLGWRDGETNGVYAYNPLDPDEGALIENYEWAKEGSGVTARLPLETFGLQPGQTIRVSAFQEGASDGWLVDWMESVEVRIPAEEPGLVIPQAEDAIDDMVDPSGDLKAIRAVSDGESIYLGMTVEGVITPGPDQVAEGMTNRYYYHWLIDADNNEATGVSNTTYENNPTNVPNPIGSEIVIQIGWRDGIPDGIYAYDPTDPDEGSLIEDFEWAAEGDSFEARLPLESLGLTAGQKVRFSAFQEGASDGWATDWMDSAELTLALPATGGGADLADGLFANGYDFTV